VHAALVAILVVELVDIAVVGQPLGRLEEGSAIDSLGVGGVDDVGLAAVSAPLEVEHIVAAAGTGLEVVQTALAAVPAPDHAHGIDSARVAHIDPAQAAERTVLAAGIAEPALDNPELQDSGPHSVSYT
jgi:hypothetical protein